MPGIFCAQESLRRNLDSVTVTATRIPVSLNQAPQSISVIKLADKPPLQGLSINEALTGIPGVFTNNANNFAQDLRLSIRGFGARAAFGIRGVKILVDGIPETTPDGQGQIDNIDVTDLYELQVLRGPSSSLYGNAAGGVLDISTLPVAQDGRRFLQGSLGIGSYGYNQYSLSGGLTTGKASHSLRVSLTDAEGYRDHADLKTATFSYKNVVDLPGDATVAFQLGLTDSPTANDAGGINLESVMENPRQARDVNVSFDAGEAIRQFKASALYQSDLISSRAYLSTRDFTGRLPFESGGFVMLDRIYGGHGSSISPDQQTRRGIIKWQIGYDLALQNDRRIRFNNLAGTMGPMTLDQAEKFAQYALYAMQRLVLPKMELSAGVRLDANLLSVDDDFLSDGDDSGNRAYLSFNPSLGVNYRLAAQHRLFANLSTSFETPALSELSANPSNTGGFNESLKPMRAISTEVGYRWGTSRHLVEAVIFYIRTSDEIVPFELADFPGRDFFMNAGKSKRLGFELSGSYRLLKDLTLSMMYSFSDFTFDQFVVDGTDLSGNQLPGIPMHQGALSFSFVQPSGWRLGLESRLVGSLWVNNANSVEDGSYALVNISAGKTVKWRGMRWTPHVGLNNILDSAYNDNIRINAFGGRYYEPGPGRMIFAGIKFDLVSHPQ